MDLNVTEYIIKIEIIREYCIRKRDGTDISCTICRQINEKEKLTVDDVS